MSPMLAWYSTRSAREQGLVAAMLALFAILLIYLLLVAPLAAAYRASLQEHLVAVERNGRAKALQAQPRSSGRTALNALDLTQYLTDSARERGLEASAQGSATGVTVTVARGAPSVVLSWLSALENAGLRLDPVRIADAGNGLVSANFNAAGGRP